MLLGQHTLQELTSQPATAGVNTAGVATSSAGAKGPIPSL